MPRPSRKWRQAPQHRLSRRLGVVEFGDDLVECRLGVDAFSEPRGLSGVKLVDAPDRAVGEVLTYHRDLPITARRKL
jgi:hypothetical protein